MGTKEQLATGRYRESKFRNMNVIAAAIMPTCVPNASCG